MVIHTIIDEYDLLYAQYEQINKDENINKSQQVLTETELSADVTRLPAITDGRFLL